MVRVQINDKSVIVKLFDVDCYFVLNEQANSTESVATNYTFKTWLGFHKVVMSMTTYTVISLVNLLGTNDYIFGL